MVNDKQIFLMKRPLQWSHLTSGLPIPKVFQELTYDILGRRLNAKDSMEVRVMFGGEVFSVKIYNIDFNRNKYDHTEILQFKYDTTALYLTNSKMCSVGNTCIALKQERQDEKVIPAESISRNILRPALSSMELRTQTCLFGSQNLKVFQRK